MKNLLYTCCALAILASCNPPANNTAASNDVGAKNKAALQKFYDDVFNKHNVALVDSFLPADYKEHSIDPGYEASREGLKKDFTDFFAGFPDIHCQTNFMVAENDLVIAHVTMTGTNSAPMAGMPATNKKVNVDGVDILRYKDGKAVEHWSYMEERKMMTQLGMLPEAGAAKDSTKTTTTVTTDTKEVKKEVTKVVKK